MFVTILVRMHGSSGAYRTTEDANSGSIPRTTPATQDELKGLMKEELRRATWESVDIVQNLLPHDSEVASKVSNTVRPTKENWPGTTSTLEKDYYSPFSGILNKTLQAARAVLGKDISSHHKSLSFSKYDDGVDGAHALKPELVGCDQEISKSKKVPWHAIRIPVEIKNSWPDMVAQAATYARCMFAASSGRQYALVIALNHISTEVRFLFFHRGGLTASPAFNLKQNDGWMHFIGAMVGLASVENRFSFGMDHSFDNSQIALPLDGRWKVDEWLFIGNCIRGRATQVVRVSRISQAAEPKTARNKRERRNHSSRGQPGPATRYTTQARLHAPVVALPEFPFAGTSKQTGGSGQKAASGDRAMAEVNRREADPNTSPKAKIERIQRKPENNALTCSNKILDLLSNDVPSNLVVKDSWPLVGRNNEKAMYEAVQGLFGVPEVLTSYEVKGPDGNPHSTMRFLPARRKFWNIWTSVDYPAPTEAGTDPEPEERVQTRHLFKTEGQDLLDARSPHELLEAILHAMIGVSLHVTVSPPLSSLT